MKQNVLHGAIQVQSRGKALVIASAAKAEGSFLDRQAFDKRATQAEQAEDRRKAMGMKKGGVVSSASKRADGCAMRGKTKGRMV
jgi:hypothetical protein